QTQPREEVAATLAVELRRAVTAHAQELSVLRARLDLERQPVAGRRRHFDRRAERSFRIGHRHLDHEVRTAPLEDLRRRDASDHVQVTGGPAVRAELALALEPDTRARLDAGGELHPVGPPAAPPPPPPPPPARPL